MMSSVNSGTVEAKKSRYNKINTETRAKFELVTLRFDKNETWDDTKWETRMRSFYNTQLSVKTQKTAYDFGLMVMKHPLQDGSVDKKM
jgi:hypothetical protein